MHQCRLALAVCGLKCHTSSANQFKCQHNYGTQLHKPPNETYSITPTAYCATTHSTASSRHVPAEKQKRPYLKM
jgi:hypothetical protein